MSDCLLQTENLTKRYGTQMAVDHVNLNVPIGKIYGLLGRNGAGKTTTLRMLMQLIQPTHGTVKIFGKVPVKNDYKIYSRIGSMIETPGFYQNLTASENLELIATLRGVHRRDAVSYALSRVGLHEETKKTVSQFSLGMKQRLGIAAAIMHEPELLILDEPINGLDPIGIQEMRLFLKSLCEEQHVSILISSHILSEVELIADKIGVIHEGRLLEELEMNELQRLSRRYIELQVSDENRSCILLEQYFQASDYEVRDEGRIRLFTHFGKQGQINRMLVENNILVSQVALGEEKLEDYFSKKIGGGGIG